MKPAPVAYEVRDSDGGVVAGHDDVVVGLEKLGEMTLRLRQPLILIRRGDEAMIGYTRMKPGHGFEALMARYMRGREP